MARIGLFFAAAGIALMAASAQVMASGSTTAASADSSPFAAGKRAVAVQNWNLAITQLTSAIRTEPSNAEAYNLLAYSYRQAGRFDEAFEYYDDALKLDPNNRNAHEYLGEAYLGVNDIDNAAKQLETLRSLCPAGCSQVDALSAAITKHQAQGS